MKQRHLALILVPAFILTILWVIFNVYHNYVSSTITDPLTYQIIPIEGKFDGKTIEEVRQRKRVNPLNEIIVVDDSGTPSPAPESTTEEASDSGNFSLDGNQEEQQ